MTSRIAVAVLAAGESKRMRSGIPKVLHAIAGKPMISHVLDVMATLDPDPLVVVLSPTMTQVAEGLRDAGHEIEIAIQDEPKGTGHAALAAKDAIPDSVETVLVVFGDTPLLRPETVRQMADLCAGGAEIVVLGFEPEDPTGYGRLVTDAVGNLTEIVEHKDADEATRAIRLCNGGAMVIRRAHLFEMLEGLGSDNAQGEVYLTDLVAAVRERGGMRRVVVAPEEETLGVDSRLGLARAEAILQQRLREAAMAGGATLTDPSTVYLSADTQLARDVIVEPNVFFGPGVTVGEGATVRAFSHLEGVTVEAGASVGPFARLRPGSRIGEGARIGNFVEVKKAEIEQGAKVSHLSYIGDARIGAEANIGAGTITCNYDGFEKHFTDIGAGAFVGSNSALVAPVKIGDGAYLGSGSVISKDVSPDALAVTRTKQFEKAGWAVRFRQRHDSSPKKKDD